MTIKPLCSQSVFSCHSRELELTSKVNHGIGNIVEWRFLLGNSPELRLHGSLSLPQEVRWDSFQDYEQILHRLEPFQSCVEVSFRSPVSVSKSSFHVLLKNLPPFLPIPVPARLVARRDFESGLHFRSLRMENRVARSGEISLSFMLLHDITRRLWSSFHERMTDSRPWVVSKEHPSNERDLTLLFKKDSAQLSPY